MNYAGFLAWLLSIGPRLPKILELLTSLFNELSPAAAPGGLEVIHVTDEEEALEASVATAIDNSPHVQQQFDGSRLRNIWKFLSESGLLQILTTLFAQKG